MGIYIERIESSMADLIARLIPEVSVMRWSFQPFQLLGNLSQASQGILHAMDIELDRKRSITITDWSLGHARAYDK